MPKGLASLDYIYENGDIDPLPFRNPILWNDHCMANLPNGSVRIISNHLSEAPFADESSSTELNELLSAS